MSPSTLRNRLLRLHRSHSAEHPQIHDWTNREIRTGIAKLLKQTSSAEAIAILEVVPTGLGAVLQNRGAREAACQLRVLAEHCRSTVRNYDIVAVREKTSVTVILWGVTSDESIPLSVAHRILSGSGSTLGPVVGAAMGRPGSDADSLLERSVRAADQARWTTSDIAVFGGTSCITGPVDPNHRVEIATKPMLELSSGLSSRVTAELWVRAPSGARTAFFGEPSYSAIDRLLVAIECTAVVLNRHRDSVANPTVTLPLSVVRASGTSPKVVQAYVEELEQPEHLTLGLVGPGGPEALQAIEPLLKPIRDAGICVERVWDYDVDKYEQAKATSANVVRLNRAYTAQLFGRIDPFGELRDGPMALAHTLDAKVTVDGVDDPERLAILRDAGVHFVTGGVAGSTSRRPFASELFAAA